MKNLIFYKILQNFYKILRNFTKFCCESDNFYNFYKFNFDRIMKNFRNFNFGPKMVKTEVYPRIQKRVGISYGLENKSENLGQKIKIVKKSEILWGVKKRGRNRHLWGPGPDPLNRSHWRGENRDSLGQIFD